MTDKMYNNTSFLAQALQQDQPNSGSQLLNLSSFYPPNSTSLGHDSLFESSFPHHSSLVTPQNNHVEIENHGVSALSLGEASHIFENYRNDRRDFEENHVDSSQNSLSDTGLNEDNGIDRLECLTNDVRRKLIASGQLERLKEQVERRLSESGWRLEMITCSRDIVRKHGSSITFDKLYEELESPAKAKVPKEVKEEFTKKVKDCYEKVCDFKFESD